MPEHTHCVAFCHLPQGRSACRKLESKLLSDLKVHPDSDYRKKMLSRVKGNLGE
jgi:hypothetical protein